MGTLADGTVIPSDLCSDPRGEAEEMGVFTSTSLRQGEVIEIIPPGHPRASGSGLVEYRVAVQFRDGAGPCVTKDVFNCVPVSLFGGVADCTHTTYRARTKPPPRGSVISDGSKVLVLCVNGDVSRGYIIGGQPQRNKGDGHNLFFEFNGVTFAIDNDGQLKVQFKGKTDAKGDLIGEDNGPTTLEITKDGSVELYTADRNQLLKLNHADKKAEFNFDTEWNVKVNGDGKQSCGGALTLDAGSIIGIKAGAAMSIETGAALTMTISGAMIVKPSGGMQLGAATDATLKGATYRRAQQELNNKLRSGLSDLGGKLQAAGPAMISANPALAGAAAQLAQAGVACSNMASAIADFESKASAFLSSKNKSD